MQHLIRHAENVANGDARGRLEDQVAMLNLLPTPTRQDGSNVAGASQENRNSPPLNALVRMLPTPEASDATGGRVSREKGGTRPSGAKRAVTLATAIQHQPGGSQSTGATTDPQSNDGKPSTGLRLKPSFVGWMMGEPRCSECGRGWTDSDCPHSATAFTSPSPISSGSP